MREPIWFTGNTRSGKSYAAHSLRSSFLKASFTHPTVVLDGDDMREVWPGLGFSAVDRITQNLRIARLAKLLTDQGVQVIVAAICPYRRLRDEVKKICNCEFRFLEGGTPPSDLCPYEPKGADE